VPALRLLALMGLLAALIAWPAQAATPLDELIEPKKDNSACFRRIFDAAHLRQHSKQTTTAMTVWLRCEAMRGTSDLANNTTNMAVLFGRPTSLRDSPQKRGDSMPVKTPANPPQMRANYHTIDAQTTSCLPKNMLQQTVATRPKSSGSKNAE
jgi:hypothetical protein